jgi:outer membrane protein assembly complex protein YaeT
VTASGIEIGRRRIERRLQDRGFADAVVEAYLNYDRGSNTVELELLVEPGQQQVLRSVVLEGLAQSEEAAAAQLEVKPGARLTARLEQRLRERTELALRAMGYWEAEVIEVERLADGSQVDLLLRVDPGLRYRLELEAPADALEVARRLLPDPTRDELHPAQTEALAELVAERLQEAGHLLAAVSVELEPGDGEQVLRLKVDPGPRLDVAAVEYPGAASLRQRQLSEAVTVKPGGTGGRMQQRISSATLELDRSSLLDLYHREGFAFATVAPPRLEKVDDGGAVRVVFEVVEGQRWSVSEVQLQNLPVEAAAELEERPLGLEAGAPWSPAAVERARARLVEALADTGYPDGRVEAEVDTSQAGLAKVVFRVEPGPFVSVGEVIIAGLVRTREPLVAGVVERAGVTPGAPLSRRRLIAAQRGLFELGLFRSVALAQMPGHESRSVRNIVVRLDEGEQRSVLVGIGYGEVDAARLTLGWSHLNLLGRAWGFAAEVSLSQRRQQYSLSLRHRRPLGLPVPGYLAVYRTTEIVADRELLRRGLWVDFGDRLRRPLRPWFRYDYEIVDQEVPIDPRNDEAVEESRVASITPSLDWDTRNNLLAPDRGLFASASLQYAFPVFLADEHFLKVQAGATVYRPLWRGFAAAGLRFGFITPFDTAPGLAENLQIPFAYRFFAGGRNSHRAFDTDSLGVPGQTLLGGSPVGGNALVLLNLEYRRHVAGDFWATAFVDAGNVWGSPSEIELGDIRWGAGLGLQYRTPAGPLRAEYAWKLERAPDEGQGQFFISFGVAF